MIETPHQDDVIKHYGQPKENLVMANLPYSMVLAWDSQVSISRFACHKMVKDEMEYIFNETLRVYGLDRIYDLNLDKFGGCYNYRKMRGGTQLSMHSWGIAVDLAPKQNRLKWGAEKAHLARPEYSRFWDIVESTGATSLGRQLDYDWMHFQFAKVK